MYGVASLTHIMGSSTFDNQTGTAYFVGICANSSKRLGSAKKMQWARSKK